MHRKTEVLGTCGLVLAFLALGAALFAPQIVRVASPSRPAMEAAAEPGKRIASRLKQRASAAGTERPVANQNSLRASLRLAFSAAGLAAILLGVLSLIRREGIFLGLLAALVGGSAIAWPFVLAQKIWPA
jgi:hypothetical protein